MKIKSVAVLGAGAVGSYVIWGLSEKKDIRLGVIASGERAKRLKNKGCKINDTVYHPEVWTPEEAHGVDFLIVSLKYVSLVLRAEQRGPAGAAEALGSALAEQLLTMGAAEILSGVYGS